MKFYFLITSVVLFNLTTYAFPIAVSEPDVAIDSIREKIRYLNKEDFICKQGAAERNTVTTIGAADHNIAISTEVTYDEVSKKYYFTYLSRKQDYSSFVLVSLDENNNIVEIENQIRHQTQDGPITYPLNVRCTRK